MTLSVAQRLARLDVRIGELAHWLDRERRDLGDWTCDGAPLPVGAVWPRTVGVIELVHPRVEVPAGWPAGAVVLDLDVGGEAFVELTLDDGGVVALGLDPNHRRLPVPGRGVAVRVEAVARSPFGVPNRSPRIGHARLVHVDVGLEALLLRLRLAVGAARALRSHEVVPAVVACAERALVGLDWPSETGPYLSRIADSDRMRGIWSLPPGLDPAPPPRPEDGPVEAAATRLDTELLALRARYPAVGRVVLTGHAHIDLAWLWPLDETRRKARRSFATALALIDAYPEFVFNQSSAQLYAIVEEDDPALFARIQAAIADRRWEPVGGSWVEFDTNMPSGEALVRQLLEGQRYFLDRFGRTATVSWMPDTFGFSPALPQLLRGAGINGLVTIKLNWSETNRFPHDLFRWEGLDGSQVLAHLFDNPVGGYNGDLGPEALLRTWENYRGKHAHPETLLSVGFGDGGGGPTAEMLERRRVLEGFPALPATRFGDVAAHVAALDGLDGLPTWVGELYLELHRGTLTTQGRTKRLNRRAERDLVAAEVAGAVAQLHGGPAPEPLDEAWRLLLRQQFHDILPGSSIREVYEVAEAELESVVATAGAAIDDRLAALAGRLVPPGGARDGLLIVNPDLSPRPLRLEAGGRPLAPAGTIDGLAAAILIEPSAAPELAASDRVLENAHVRVQLADDGTIASYAVGPERREALDGRGNQLWAYVDRPRAWDAWDVDEGYADDGEEIVDVRSLALVEDGPHRAAIRVERRFRASTIVQEYRLWASSPRLDIVTWFDWHDRRWLLKARFPCAVRATHARFESAFGLLERPTHRNTSWDAARFEVAAHRFVHLAEPGFGVALLNDGRYGHHALGAELGLSLLRSPVYPDPLADEGAQTVTYALLAHAGADLVEGGVLAEAEDLNRPLLVRPVRASEPASWASPIGVTGPALGLGTLKPAVDGRGLILRVYEPHGGRGPVGLRLPGGWRVDGEVDLLERPAPHPDGRIRPFEVRSWRLVHD